MKSKVRHWTARFAMVEVQGMHQVLHLSTDQDSTLQL